MEQPLERRINISSYWASSRISLLDSIERYEDSYAITQEFREWINCLGDSPEHLDEYVLMVPNYLDGRLAEEINDTDEVIEI